MHVLLFGNGGNALRQALRNARYHRVASRNDLASALHHSVADVVGTAASEKELVARSETLFVPPYLDLIVLDIVRGSPDADVKLFPPGAGHPMVLPKIGGQELRFGASISTFVMRRPVAGTWIFRKSDPAARVLILSQEFFPHGMLIEPSASARLRPRDRVSIAYRLVDGEGGDLRELPAYPLAVTISLTTPTGGSLEVPLRRLASNASLFRSLTSATCGDVGRYWTEVRVMTLDENRRPLLVFSDRWAGFTVGPEAHVAATAGKRLLHVAADVQLTWTAVLLVGALMAGLAAWVIARRRRTDTSRDAATNPLVIRRRS
jgi:hypothetical protein